MNNSKIILMGITALLSFSSCKSQMQYVATEHVKIYGNCELCENTIESAGHMKNVAKVEWDKNTKMAVLTYDAHQTNSDIILKRIALSGYDSEKFLAPDEAYAALPVCCQYERVTKLEVAAPEATEDHSAHDGHVASDMTTDISQETNPLQTVFDRYFVLKDALVASDGPLASTKANELLTAVNNVDMAQLPHETHLVWMQVMTALKSPVKQMASTRDIDAQRDHFISLSDMMYQLLKVSELDTPTYYQHCPMANEGKGAYWLSKEEAIKNPYYGAQMMRCGKTIETITKR